MRRLIAISAGALALAAAGCGGGGGGSSTSASSAPASSAPVSGNVAKVSMKSIQFNPKTLTVNTGTTVVWTNDDPVGHDVTKQSGPGPQFSSGSGDIGGGGTYKQTFNAAGTIKYVCTVHPGMTGTIVVR